jgi:putative aminopeptidase FrvX
MAVVEQVDRDRLVHTFLDLVAIDSPSGEEAEISAELQRRFVDLGCDVTRDHLGNIVAVLPGRREGALLVSTHMDTVGTNRGIVPIIGDDVIRTDGNHFNAHGLPCVGLPTGMVDEHAATEHIAIDDMVTACRIMAAIVTQPHDS